MSFLPNHVLVTANDASPSRWMLALHGILGSAQNLRTLARRVAELCPAWGFVLPDLRNHGLSQGAPPPHTIAAAAEDLLRLEVHLAPRPITAVLGHSFGGKVALSFADHRAARGEPLDQLWVLDADPGTGRERTSDARRVIEVLRKVPDPLPSRERFFEVVLAEGLSRSIAEWLAMNVRREGDALRLRLDVSAIEALLEDYFARDLWPVLERAPAGEVHMVLGGRSDALGPDDRARLASLAPAVRTHVLEGAGHWVHVDAFEPLVALVAGALRG